MIKLKTMKVTGIKITLEKVDNSITFHNTYIGSSDKAKPEIKKFKIFKDILGLPKS